jgi:hypothetical protein
MSDLAIDLYLPGTTNTPSTLTMHGGAFQTSYISGRQPRRQDDDAGGRHDPELVPALTRGRRRARCGAPSSRSATRSRMERGSTADTNAGGPISRETIAVGGMKMAVLNAGIGGNRVLNEALVPRAPTCGPSAPASTRWRVSSTMCCRSRCDPRHRAGRHQRHRQRAAELDAERGRSDRRAQAAHRAGARARLKIVGATLTPFWGAAAYTEAGEAKRQALNE